MSARDDVLAVLEGRRPAAPPCFSGLINVIAPGLQRSGLELHEVHADPVKMATAAATSPRFYGFGSAVVPLDICVEAELLGAEVEFGAPGDLRLPRVEQPPFGSAASAEFSLPPDVASRPRVSTVVEAVEILRVEIGGESAIGAWVPGPYTLATLLVDLPSLLADSRSDPGVVGDLLDRLTGLLAAVANAYRAAGADFVTVHEMGGSPGFIGPAPFETLVLPRLRQLHETINGPTVLSVCGRTDHAVELLAAAGADALSVDQLNDLGATRESIGDRALLFGNIDPVGVLSDGGEASVREAVAGALASGVDAIWPGCDLVPGMPEGNLTAMIDESALGGRRDGSDRRAES